MAQSSPKTTWDVIMMIVTLQKNCTLASHFKLIWSEFAETNERRFDLLPYYTRYFNNFIGCAKCLVDKHYTSFHPCSYWLFILVWTTSCTPALGALFVGVSACPRSWPHTARRTTPHCSAHERMADHETQSGSICICRMERYIINNTS